MESEELKTVQEVAKFGTRALDSVDELGKYLSGILGTVPQDVVGVLGGDLLHDLRLRGLSRLFKRTQEINAERGLEETQAMSPSVVLPLLNAAQDETREELAELWARLLANGLHPDRSKEVRVSVINAVRQFDPLDAQVLDCSGRFLGNKQPGNPPSLRGSVRTEEVRSLLEVNWDEIDVSLSNLERCGCVHSIQQRHVEGLGLKQDKLSVFPTYFGVTALGREIIKACSL